MSHRDYLMRELAQLPYSEMMQLAEQLATELKGIHSAQHLADVISRVAAASSTGPDEKAEREEAILAKALKRPTAVNVKRETKGWTVSCRLATVRATTLPEAFRQLTDQIVVGHIMST